MPKPSHDRPMTRVVLLAAGSLTVMSGATIAPALPAIRAQFADVPGADMWTRLVLTLPALFVVLWAPFAGAIADRYGRKRLLSASVLLYVVAGASGCVAPSLPALLVGRACLGIAVGGITTSVLALSVDIVEESARASFMGLHGAVMAFGGMTFVVAGGILTELHWRAPFAVYLAAAPVLALVVLVLREPKRGENGAGSKSPVPRRALAPIYAAAALLQVAFYVLPVQLPFLLDAHMGVGPLGAGIALATGALAAAVMALMYKYFRRHASFQTLTAVSLAIMGGGYVMLALSDSY
jgi:MFS family permease